MNAPRDAYVPGLEEPGPGGPFLVMLFTGPFSLIREGEAGL